MAVRRLGQSVADLLCQRNAGTQARASICIAQQRGMAGSPKQQDVNGIPVEVSMSLPSLVVATPTIGQKRSRTVVHDLRLPCLLSAAFASCPFSGFALNRQGVEPW